MKEHVTDDSIDFPYVLCKGDMVFNTQSVYIGEPSVLKLGINAGSTLETIMITSIPNNWSINCVCGKMTNETSRYLFSKKDLYNSSRPRILT